LGGGQSESSLNKKKKKKKKKEKKKCRASAPFAAKNTLRSRTLAPRSRFGAAGAAWMGMLM
jgi:hypothetical protein